MIDLSVIHIATTDIKGGAATASFRQHKGLTAVGIESKILTLIKLTNDDSIIRFDYNTNLLQRILRRLRKIIMEYDRHFYRSTRSAGLELFSDDRVHLGSQLLNQIGDFDLINLHWFTQFFDFSLIKKIAKSKPVIVTLHDQWFFTGGCHYDLGCGRYQDRCGECPQLGSTQRKDLSSAILARKISILNKCNPEDIVIVASTKWLQKKAQSSALVKKFNVELIPYGIDINKFQPKSIDSTETFRNRLGFLGTDILVLFVSTGSNLPRKGYVYLKTALEKLHFKNTVKLLTVGRGIPKSPQNVHHLHIDHVSDEQELSLIYSAADIFVMPSTEEAYGLTALEAMACGTPVIGFRTGMCADTITDGKNGFVVDVGDVDGLCHAILQFMKHHNNNNKMGHFARQYVKNNLTTEMNASRYLKLYKTMLERRINRRKCGS